MCGTGSIKTYRRGLESVPDNLKLRYSLAVVLNKEGHEDEAVKELHHVLEIDPNYTDARKALDALSN